MLTDTDAVSRAAAAAAAAAHGVHEPVELGVCAECAAKNGFGGGYVSPYASVAAGFLGDGPPGFNAEWLARRGVWARRGPRVMVGHVAGFGWVDGEGEENSLETYNRVRDWALGEFGLWSAVLRG